MSMYDKIRCTSMQARELGLVCCNDHPLTSFQSKDCENELNAFLVFGGHFYEEAQRPWHEITPDEALDNVQLLGDDQLGIVHTTIATLYGITREVVIYGFCEECPRLLIAKRPLFGTDIATEKVPLFEFRLTLQGGRVAGLARLRTESMEKMRQDAINDGATPLDEEDPIAIAHRALKRRNERAEGTV